MDSVAELGAVEGAIFGIMGLLLAFAISGALQRFDDRRQLVLQNATAVSAAYDRALACFKASRENSHFFRERTEVKSPAIGYALPAYRRRLLLRRGRHSGSARIFT